jgi:hypothetical protein
VVGTLAGGPRRKRNEKRWLAMDGARRTVISGDDGGDAEEETAAAAAVVVIAGAVVDDVVAADIAAVVEEAVAANSDAGKEVVEEGRDDTSVVNGEDGEVAETRRGVQGAGDAVDARTAGGEDAQSMALSEAPKAREWEGGEPGTFLSDESAGGAASSSETADAQDSEERHGNNAGTELSIESPITIEPRPVMALRGWMLRRARCARSERSCC